MKVKDYQDDKFSYKEVQKIFETTWPINELS
jgi:hypothetical protein